MEKYFQKEKRARESNQKFETEELTEETRTRKTPKINCESDKSNFEPERFNPNDESTDSAEYEEEISNSDCENSSERK